MKEEVYKCSKCGSTDVEFRRWYNPNTLELGVDCEDDECWCNGCEEHTRTDVVEIEMPNGTSQKELEQRYNDFMDKDDYECLDAFVNLAKEVLQPVLDHEKMRDDVCGDFEEEIHEKLRGLVVELGLKYRKELLSAQEEESSITADIDKKIFLLDKTAYREDIIQNLTEKDLEEWVAEVDYDDNYTIIKIDANSYDSVDEALENEGVLFPEDYYIFSFGF